MTTDVKTLARETSAKLIPHTTSVHNVDVIIDLINLVKRDNGRLTDRMFDILNVIVDSTAVLNHLDIDHLEELCAVIKDYKETL